MAFIKIADVYAQQDRLCFYFSFSQEDGVVFAAKKQEKGEISSYRSADYHDIFAWIGFGSLATALYQSKFFTKKYRMTQAIILHGQLMAVTINDVPVFFYKDNQREWQWTYDEDVIATHFSGEATLRQVEICVGHDFLNGLRKYNKEVEYQKVAYNHYMTDKAALLNQNIDLLVMA